MQCVICNEYFHRSCAGRVSLNKKDTVNICCAQKSSNSDNQQRVNIPNSQQNATSPVLSNSDFAPSGINLDNNLIPLWNLIENKVVSKLVEIKMCLTSTNDRFDTVEDRIGDLEEEFGQFSLDVYKETMERITKQKNIIIFNMDDSRDAHRTDLPAIQNIFTQCGEILPFDVNSIKAVRLGRNFIQGKIRPLKVMFQSPDHVDWVFMNKKKLSDGSLSIKGDLTKRQQDEIKSLRAELQSRRAEGEDDLFIAYSNRNPYIAKKKRND